MRTSRSVPQTRRKPPNIASATEHRRSMLQSTGRPIIPTQPPPAYNNDREPPPYTEVCLPQHQPIDILRQSYHYSYDSTAQQLPLISRPLSPKPFQEPAPSPTTDNDPVNLVFQRRLLLPKIAQATEMQKQIEGKRKFFQHKAYASSSSYLRSHYQDLEAREGHAKRELEEEANELRAQVAKMENQIAEIFGVSTLEELRGIEDRRSQAQRRAWAECGDVVMF